MSTRQMKCSHCNQEIDHFVHFCPFCGVLLGKIDALPFEDVNLIFLRADLSGFTAMCETMIAEEVMSYLNEVFDIFSKIISSYKGTVYQIIGDEMVSIFGLDKGAGFTPHMAILSAEEMVIKLYEYNKKFPKKIGLKIGSEIEKVLILNIQDNLQDSLIITQGFKKSQILQKNAEENTIYIGENLYEATKSFFDYEEIGEFVQDNLTVKAYEYKVRIT